MIDLSRLNQVINLSVIQLNENNYHGYLLSSQESYYSQINISSDTSTQLIESVTSGVEIGVSGFIASIEAGGLSLSPVQDLNNPLPYEYLYNPYNNTLTFYQDFPSILVFVIPPQIKKCPPLLSSTYPALFSQLPIEGQFNIIRSFEDFPSADAEFSTTAPKEVVMDVLKPGREIDLFGIPLRVNSISISEIPRAIAPDMRLIIKVSFGGKWENYSDEVVFLRSDGANIFGEDGDSCNNQNNDSNSREAETSVKILLNRAGADYSGAALQPVPIPSNTPQDATVNPFSLLPERALIAGGFIYYSNPQAVEIKPIDGTKVWEYREDEILSPIDSNYDAVEGEPDTSYNPHNFYPDLPNYSTFPSTPTSAPIPTLRDEADICLGFEYRNAELSGEFSEPLEADKQEDTQSNNKPRWVRKPPRRETKIEGDVTAHAPLEGVSNIKVMSLCFDIGGQTKERKIVNYEDGTKVSETSETWGFAYTAKGIYNDATNQLLGFPEDEWGLLKQTTATYIYDEGTGYLLYIIEQGFDTVRFKQESVDNPETLETEDSQELNLYEFRRVGTNQRTSNFLRLLPEYTAADAVDWYKVCDRDGSSSWLPVYNPNWAPPYYIERRRQESNSFAYISNPDFEEGGNPILVTGEESRFESSTQISIAEHEYIILSDGSLKKGEELQPQKYLTFNYQFKSQGTGISQMRQEVDTQEGQGDPPLATRKAEVFYQANNPDVTIEDVEEQEDRYRYFIRTRGYSSLDPINGSESFPAAKTLFQVLTAAKTKLAIENWKSGYSENLEICGNLEIKEGDRFNYTCNGERRKRVILSVNHTLDILGSVSGEPQVTVKTKLSLGRYRLPELNYSKHKIPQFDGGATGDGNALVVVKKTLGSILPWFGLQSRRNF